MKIHILSIHTWFWSAWNVLSIIFIVIDWYCTDTKQHIWDTFIPDDETSNIIEDQKNFVVFIELKVHHLTFILWRYRRESASAEYDNFHYSAVSTKIDIVKTSYQWELLNTEYQK